MRECEANENELSYRAVIIARRQVFSDNNREYRGIYAAKCLVRRSSKIQKYRD